MLPPNGLMPHTTAGRHPFTSASAASSTPLLIQGLADDNVFPVHTLRLSSALLAASHPHEVLPLRGAGHRPSGEGTVEQLLRHELDFLRRSLGLS